MNKQEITALVQEDMRRAVLEAKKLEQCEHSDDFIALLLTIAEDMQVFSDKYYQLANSDISDYEQEQEPERTDTIENICTSVNDKNIDEWLEMQEIVSSMRTPDLQQEQHTEQEQEKPYECFVCDKSLAFPDAFFYQKFVYCKDHLPEYRKDEQF